MLILSLIGGGIYYVFYYRKEGEECALDEKDDKYDEFGKFKYNDKKECVLDSCNTGYKKVGDSCVGSDPNPNPNPNPNPSDVALYCKETIPCLTGGSGSCGGTNIGRGKKCSAYNTVKLDGYTLCTNEQSALVPSGTSVGEYVTNCAVDCEWVKKNNETLKFNCDNKYRPQNCIPLGDSGNLDITDSHTYFGGIWGGKTYDEGGCRVREAVSCKDHGLTSCPLPGTGTGTGTGTGPGCGSNTNWSIIPKSAEPKHSDYFVPTDNYCKPGGKTMLGERLYPIVNVPITRCWNNVKETKNVKGSLFVPAERLTELGYKNSCNYIGFHDNCGYYKSCYDMSEVAWRTCTIHNAEDCRFRYLLDRGSHGEKDFDSFLKGIDHIPTVSG